MVPIADDRDVYTFREETRPVRMEIASEAEGRFERKVSWGVRTGEEERMFTTLSLPAMTRLRFREREILDTSSPGVSPAAAARRWRGACGSSAPTRRTG